VNGVKKTAPGFSQNWVKSSAWQGTCRLLIVTLTDGSQYTAHFKVKGKCTKNHDHSHDDDDDEPGTGGTTTNFGMAYFQEPVIPTRLNYAVAGATLKLTMFIPGATKYQTVFTSVTSVAEACPTMPSGDDEAYDALEDKAQKTRHAFRSSIGTSTSWKKTRRAVTVKLTDGDTYVVHFKFRASDNDSDCDDHDRWLDKGHYNTSKERDRYKRD